MKKNEIAFFESIHTAMAKCPRVASGFGSPTAAVGAYVNAYYDFAEVVRLGTVAIGEYLLYKRAEKHLNDPSCETEWIEETLDKAYSTRNELVEYVEKRTKDGWA